MKILKKLILISFILLLAFYQAKAQTQFEMNQEAHENYLKADNELNLVYKKLINSLDKKEKTLLIKAQKDWIKFRDSHCEFEAQEYEGGSIRPMIYSNCLQECTETRINNLKIILESRAKK